MQTNMPQKLEFCDFNLIRVQIRLTQTSSSKWALTQGKAFFGKQNVVLIVTLATWVVMVLFGSSWHVHAVRTCFAAPNCRSRPLEIAWAVACWLGDGLIWTGSKKVMSGPWKGKTFHDTSQVGAPCFPSIDGTHHLSVHLDFPTVDGTHHVYCFC